MNRGSKMKGELIGITEMKSWLLIMQGNQKNQQSNKILFYAADMKRRKCDHSENNKSRMSKDE